MDDRIGLDGGGALRLGHQGRLGQRVDLALQNGRRLTGPGAFARRGAVQSDGVLGDIPAICGHKPFGSGPGAQAVHHGDDGVHDIIVSRAAEIGQSAGYGQPARIVFGKAQFLTADLHGGRKTRIKIDMVDLAHPPAGHRESTLAHAPDRRRRVERGPVGDMEMIGGVRAAMEEHPFVLRDPKRAGLGHAGHHQTGHLIDLDDGIHIFRVRKTDQAVFLRRRGNLLGTAGGRKPGTRVPGRNGRERRHEPAHRLHVVRDRPAPRLADRVLDHRIGVGRKIKAVRGFERARAGPRIAPQFRRRVVLLAPGRQIGARAQQLQKAVEELRARQQRDLGLALRDLLGQPIDRHLRGVAAHRRIDLPARGDAQAPGERTRRIDRLGQIAQGKIRRIDREPDHQHGVDGGQHQIGPGIGEGAARGFLGHFHGRQRLRRIGPLKVLGGAHKDRSAVVGHAGLCLSGPRRAAACLS